MATGYKNTKMMGRKRARERERFICLLFLICAHTAQKQINLSKQKATKKIPKVEEEDEEKEAEAAEAVDGKKSEHLMWIT